MTRRIGIHAIAYHQYLLPTFCRILGDHQLTVFTTPSGREECDALPDVESAVTEFVEKRPDESWSAFFDRIEAKTADLDALVVVTARGPLAAQLEFLSFDPYCPTLGWMHAVNEFAGSPSHALATTLAATTTSLKDVTSLRGPVERAFSLYRMLTRPYPLVDFDAVFVSYSPMESRLASAGWPTPVHALYPAVFDRPARSAREDELHVTVPGVVAQVSRDYESLLSGLERVWSSSNDSLRVTLLGGAAEADPSLRRRCRELAATRQLEWYPDTDWIPEAEFDRVLSETDLLCSPLQPSRSSFPGFPPYRYGFTKASGVFLDAIEYGLPVLVPDWFPVDDELADVVYPCEESQSTAETLVALGGDPDRFDSWAQDARANARQFTLEAQRERFDRALTDLTGGERSTGRVGARLDESPE
jgi:glycosyltransferase involved in cell wall biosynthesis